MTTTARVVDDGGDGGITRTENGTTGAGRRRTSSSSYGPRAKSAREDDRPPVRIETAGTTAASSSSSGIESKSGIASKLGRMYKRLSSGSWQIALAADDVSSTSSSSSSNDDDNAEQRSSAWERNVLSEGEYYLAMSMLVYVYALLRESSVLGHTDISFDEIDVNSYQSDPGRAVTTVGEKNGRGGGGGGKFLSKTKSAGFIVRVVMDELEKKGAFSSVEMNEGDMSVLREFKQWVSDSHTKKIDTATEKTIKELRRKVARRRWRRAIHAVRLMVRLGHCTSGPFNQRRGENPGFRRKGRGGTMGGLRCSTTDSIVNLSKALQKAPSMSGAMSILSTEQQSKLAKESDIKDIIDGALEQPRFFIEGSLLSNLIESGIEVVKFGDRHPNDVVYSICCNRQYKRVSVVFRGTVNSHNWLMNMKFAMTEHPNPIPEDYPGREDTLGLHTGFSLYLTRQRKDDSLTKIEEIFANIDSIGKELAPDGDYQLSITGHSLGGALANILSFYAATSSLFAHVKTIRVFTYAAPRVGCQRFAYAFQHLERIGKIRMARFTNTRDLVPLIPFHGMSRSYKHVGMHIRMHGVTQYAQYWLRQALDVSYPRNHGIWSQLWRGLRSSLIRNLNSVQGYKRAHTLSEYQRRIRFALEYRSILAQAGNLHNIIRSRLKTLDEYYFIKGASNVTCTGALTRVSLEDRAKENVRREARKIVVVVALIAMLEAIVIGSFHYKSIGVPEIQDLFCDNSMIFSLTENKAPPNGKDEKTGPVSGGVKSSWTSSWMKWFEKAPASSQPPCVWGHCSFPSRPYLPWGVPMQHTLSVATINSDSWHFQPVGSQRELSWEAQQLFCREDIHHRASEMILARSRGEISE